MWELASRQWLVNGKSQSADLLTLPVSSQTLTKRAQDESSSEQKYLPVGQAPSVLFGGTSSNRKSIQFGIDG